MYEYRCATCDCVFEQRRAMADADRDVHCPDGHGGVKRLLPVFAAGGRAQTSAPAPASAPVRGCGAGCGCH